MSQRERLLFAASIDSHQPCWHRQPPSRFNTPEPSTLDPGNLTTVQRLFSRIIWTDDMWDKVVIDHGTYLSLFSCDMFK